jgi:hypothetical protein
MVGVPLQDHRVGMRSRRARGSGSAYYQSATRLRPPGSGTFPLRHDGSGKGIAPSRAAGRLLLGSDVIADLATTGCIEAILFYVVKLDLIEIQDGLHEVILQSFGCRTAGSDCGARALIAPGAISSV